MDKRLRKLSLWSSMSQLSQCRLRSWERPQPRKMIKTIHPAALRAWDTWKDQFRSNLPEKDDWVQKP